MTDTEAIEANIALARFMMAQRPFAVLFLWPWLVCPRLTYWISVRVGRLLFPRED